MSIGRTTKLIKPNVYKYKLRLMTSAFSRPMAFFQVLLKGIGQIMLQENALTGLMFLIGIFWSDIPSGIGVLIGVLSGTLTAIWLRFDTQEVQSGLYGFSAALVGVAMFVLFEPSPSMVTLTILGAILASILQYGFIRLRFPAYTFPFIIITWLLYYVALNVTDETLVNTPDAYVSSWFAVSSGFGQVIFQGNILSGVLFVLAVGLSSYRAALFGMIASGLGALSAFALGFDPESIFGGIFGFNAVLSAIVFSQSEKKQLLWLFISVLFTLGLHFFLIFTNWFSVVGGVFTFPFVAGVWLTLGFKKLFYKI